MCLAVQHCIALQFATNHKRSLPTSICCCCCLSRHVCYKLCVTCVCVQNAARRAREHAAGALTDAMFVEDSNGADGLAVDGAAATAAGDDAEAVAVAYQSDLAKELAGGQDAAQDGHEEEMVDEEQDEDADKTNKAAANTKTSGSKVSGTAAAAGDDETAAMKDIMMTRKNRKLYERIKRAQEGQKERADVLITRKKKLEQQQQQQSKKHKA